MKKKELSIVLLLAFLSLLSFALAEEFVGTTQQINQVELPSITDDVEKNVTNFDILKEKIGLWLTFKKEKKIEKELKLAGLMLNKARIAARKNDTKNAEKFIEEHNRIMERVRKKFQEMAKNNISSSKLTGLDRAIQVHEIKIQRFNERLQNENISEKQRENIEKMLNNSQKSIEVLRQLRELREERERIRANMNASGNGSISREEVRQIIRESRKSREK